MTKLAKLVELGSPAPGGTFSIDGAFGAKHGRDAAAALRPILGRRNGFYAFEGALHVLADGELAHEESMVAWNEPDLWRRNYDGMAENGVFFAEDVFGGQFCLLESAVHTFDPETGEFKLMAIDLEEWASKILADYDLLTGYRFAREWQLAHGAIPAGSRLVPTIPFVLGGKLEISNLHLEDAAIGMRYRAAIAVQIRDLPDGSSVELRVSD